MGLNYSDRLGLVIQIVSFLLVIIGSCSQMYFKKFEQTAQFPVYLKGLNLWSQGNIRGLHQIIFGWYLVVGPLLSQLQWRCGGIYLSSRTT